MIAIKHGPHQRYYRVGNIVECRCCKHAIDAGELHVQCGSDHELRRRGERCVNFRRSPGADDDCEPFFPLEYQ